MKKNFTLILLLVISTTKSMEQTLPTTAIALEQTPLLPLKMIQNPKSIIEKIKKFLAGHTLLERFNILNTQYTLEERFLNLENSFQNSSYKEFSNHIKSFKEEFKNLRKQNKYNLGSVEFLKL